MKYRVKTTFVITWTLAVPHVLRVWFQNYYIIIKLRECTWSCTVERNWLHPIIQTHSLSPSLPLFFSFQSHSSSEKKLWNSRLMAPTPSRGRWTMAAPFPGVVSSDEKWGRRGGATEFLGLLCHPQEVHAYACSLRNIFTKKLLRPRIHPITGNGFQS